MLKKTFTRFRLTLREARVIRVSFLVAGGVQLLAWIIYFWFVIPRLATSPFFSLHYTVYFGVDRIGAPWRLASIPLIGLVILFINAVLVSRFYVGSRFIAVLVAVATVFFEIMLLWAVFLNILLNV